MSDKLEKNVKDVESATILLAAATLSASLKPTSTQEAVDRTETILRLMAAKGLIEQAWDEGPYRIKK